MPRSLSSRRAWIEMDQSLLLSAQQKSLSSRRAWIEIQSVCSKTPQGVSRSPRGERGLKFGGLPLKPPPTTRRSPRGERGLKSIFQYIHQQPYLSLSSRRAWIEILQGLRGAINVQSLSSRRAWIEIKIPFLNIFSGLSSLSSRRAWIEISID